jgi:hypothetical protein
MSTQLAVLFCAAATALPLMVPKASPKGAFPAAMLRSR